MGILWDINEAAGRESVGAAPDHGGLYYRDGNNSDCDLVAVVPAAVAGIVLAALFFENIQMQHLIFESYKANTFIS